MMNFDTMDPSMGDYPPLDGGMEPSMDPHLNPGLLQDLDAEGLPVPGSELLMEGMFSELHSAVSEGGVPVTAAHFDLQEEMLWTGNHRVRTFCRYRGIQVLVPWKMGMQNIL